MQMIHGYGYRYRYMYLNSGIIAQFTLLRIHVAISDRCAWNMRPRPAILIRAG